MIEEELARARAEKKRYPDDPYVAGRLKRLERRQRGDPLFNLLDFKITLDVSDAIAAMTKVQEALRITAAEFADSIRIVFGNVATITMPMEMLAGLRGITIQTFTVPGTERRNPHPEMRAFNELVSVVSVPAVPKESPGVVPVRSEDQTPGIPATSPRRLDLRLPPVRAPPQRRGPDSLQLRWSGPQGKRLACWGAALRAASRLYVPPAGVRKDVGPGTTVQGVDRILVPFGNSYSITSLLPLRGPARERAYGLDKCKAPR